MTNARTCLSALRGGPLPVYGDGQQVRDWLYVEDHAEALVTVLTEGEVGETYNIGGRNERKNLAVVEAICDLLEELAEHRKADVVESYRDSITFVADRPGHDRRYAIDPSKVERELSWRSRETFESGLRKTVARHLEREPWWKRVLSGAYRLERLGVGADTAKVPNQ